jgi:hypothetical protein
MNHQNRELKKMNRRNVLATSRIFFLTAIIFIVVGCAPKMVTKGQTYPLIYEEQPVSILILPPINESTAAEAKEYYSTTIQEPLSYSGYYVLPYELTTDLLKMEGIYDTELLKNVPLSKFREYFGADAVLFTTIKIWNLSYMVIAANLTVSINCEIKSTKTDRTLWKYNGTVVVDLSGGSTSNDIVGLIAKIVITAVQAAAADYVPHARTANVRALHALPYGKYHNLFMQDKEFQFVDKKQP